MKVTKKNPELQSVEKPFFSTGSTILNLACSDTAVGAFKPGSMVNIVGDKQTGKSIIALTVLAEAARNPAFKEYKLIYDDVEAALCFNIPKLFGEKLASKIVGPNGVVGESRSDEILEFYYNLDDLLDEGTPFVYVLDSMDSLTSKSEQAKFEENKKLFRDGKAIKGSYGDGKAKVNSENLRQIVGRLKLTGSLLIIISQTRDDINPMSFATKTRSGGKALGFYALHEMWLAKKSSIKKTIKGKDRDMGVQVVSKISKNKSTGRQGKVEFPILHSYGIDDISSCIDYLVEEGVWKKAGKNINTGEFGFDGTRKALEVFIDTTKDKYQEVTTLCEVNWKEVNEAASIGRKPKYE